MTRREGFGGYSTLGKASNTGTKMPNRLQQLHDAGVSIWLDFIERTILHNGDLERRIRDDALTGMTSNPTIFEKALAEGSAYDAQLREAAGDLTALQLFELVATTATSRSRCRRPPRTTSKGRSTKHTACGRPWIGRTCS